MKWYRNHLLSAFRLTKRRLAWLLVACCNGARSYCGGSSTSDLICVSHSLRAVIVFELQYSVLVLANPMLSTAIRVRCARVALRTYVAVARRASFIFCHITHHNVHHVPLNVLATKRLGRCPFTVDEGRPSRTTVRAPANATVLQIQIQFPWKLRR